MEVDCDLGDGQITTPGNRDQDAQNAYNRVFLIGAVLTFAAVPVALGMPRRPTPSEH